MNSKTRTKSKTSRSPKLETGFLFDYFEVELLCACADSQLQMCLAE